MADRTSIEWTDATWNPIRAVRRDTGKVGWHCEAVSDGCKNCYASPINEVRFGTGLPYKPGHRAEVDIIIDPKTLREPMRWRRPRTIFVCSMTDLFGDFIPLKMIDRVFAVMALTQGRHTYQVLTKRSARMRAYLSDPQAPGRIARILIDEVLIAKTWRHDPETWPVKSIGDIDNPDDVTTHWPLGNVWCGVSAEDQRTADQRVPDLLASPATIRFVSAEPLLGPINFHKIPMPGRANGYRASALHGHEEPDAVGGCLEWVPPLNWIIVGGESGPGARAMHPAWARSIRDQCRSAHVPFMFKQWGSIAPLEVARPVEAYHSPGALVAWPDGTVGPGDAANNGGPGIQLFRATKGIAGRQLDGRTHDELATPL